MLSTLHRRIAAFVAIALVSSTLAGCVVVPERPYYGHYYHGYYYR